MIQSYPGWLEVDPERGVIYFHLINQVDMQKTGSVTKLRICSLPTPIPEQGLLDITYGHGVSWLDPASMAEEGDKNGARDDSVAGGS